MRISISTSPSVSQALSAIRHQTTHTAKQAIRSASRNTLPAGVQTLRSRLNKERKRSRITNLLVHHAAVHVQASAGGTRHGRMLCSAASGIELNSNSRRIRDDEEALLALNRSLHDFALWRPVFADGVLLDGKVGNAGGNLQAGGGANRR